MNVQQQVKKTVVFGLSSLLIATSLSIPILPVNAANVKEVNGNKLAVVSTKPVDKKATKKVSKKVSQTKASSIDNDPVNDPGLLKRVFNRFTGDSEDILAAATPDFMADQSAVLMPTASINTDIQTPTKAKTNLKTASTSTKSDKRISVDDIPASHNTLSMEEIVKQTNSKPVQRQMIEQVKNQVESLVEESKALKAEQLQKQAQVQQATAAQTAPQKITQPAVKQYSQPKPVQSVNPAPQIQGSGVQSNIYNMLAAAGVGKLEELDSTPSGGPVKVLKSGVSANVNTLDLTVGKAVVLNLSSPAARVSISNPEIASAVIISPTQVQLVGNAVGVANLLLWNDAMSAEHTVIDISVQRDVGSLIRQLKYVDPGIEIVPMAADDTVILTGQAQNRETAQLAVKLAKAYFKGSSTGGAPAAPTGGGGAVANVGDSQAPGSAVPASDPNVINLIKVKGEPSTKVEMVRQQLAGIDPGIDLNIVPGPGGDEKAILTGRVATASAVSKAINLTSIFYGQPGIRVITGPGGNMIRETEGDTAFQNDESFNSNLNVNVLQGSVMTDSTGNVISMMEVAYKPQVRCKVQFLEISRSDLDSLGATAYGMGGPFGIAHLSGGQNPAPGKPIGAFDTTQTGVQFGANGNTMTSGTQTGNTQSIANGFAHQLQDGITQFLSINSQTAVAISALQEKRKARSLAEPTLNMLSGEKASFLAGGEIPIPVIGSNGQVDVEYREFGIRMNIVATVTDEGKIHMMVSPEVSSLDAANGVSTNSVTIPGFRTRRMQTTLELADHQSFIMAGLYNQDDVRSMSGTPWISQIPIIGSFFRNKWKTQSNNEMVVVISPEIINGPSIMSAPPQAPRAQAAYNASQLANR